MFKMRCLKNGLEIKLNKLRLRRSLKAQNDEHERKKMLNKYISAIIYNLISSSEVVCLMIYFALNLIHCFLKFYKINFNHDLGLECFNNSYDAYFAYKNRVNY